MKGKCYYCNKELTERSIKRHAKNCEKMQETIKREKAENNKTRKQFIISLKDKYDRSTYCIYLSISAELQLIHLDKFLRDVWCECCNHLSCFTIRGMHYNHNNYNGMHEMNVTLNEVLQCGDKFVYEYDFGSTTCIEIEVVDEIKVSKDHSMIEIVARNNPLKEGKNSYFNSPRDGVCGYVGNADFEKEYLPNNKNKFKKDRHRPKIEEENDDLLSSLSNMFSEEGMDILRGISNGGLSDFNDFDENMEEIFNQTLMKSLNRVVDSLDRLFSRGKNSFDIKELVNSLAKKNIKIILANNNINLPSSFKKEQAAQLLLDKYAEMIEEKLEHFDTEKIHILKKCIKNNGIIENPDDDYEKYLYFMNNGMIFPTVIDNEPVFIMPYTMQEKVNKFDSIEMMRKAKENEEIIELFRGMIKAYGILSFDDVYSIFNMYINDLAEDKLLSILQENSIYYGEYEAMMYGKENILFKKSELEDYIEFMDEIDADIDFKKFTKEQLIELSKIDYLEECSYGRRFLNELSSLMEIDYEGCIEGMEVMMLDMQYRTKPEIIKDIIGEVDVDEEDISRFSNIISRFLDNIPLWKFKGMSLSDIKNSKKGKKEAHISRNDLCPCGSGRKYKVCCGKNDNVIKIY